jgi:hypothetical protein
MKQSQKTFAAVAVATIVLLTMLVAGCTGSDHKQTTQSTDASGQKSNQPVKYTCSMHPEVIQDKPGDCPKCGMNLVEKK